MTETSKRDSNQTEIESFVVAEFDHLPKVESPNDMDESEDSGPKKRQKTSEDDMLYFTRGDVIKVTSKDSSGWWWGQRYNMKTKQQEGEAGWLPESYHHSNLTRRGSCPEEHGDACTAPCRLAFLLLHSRSEASPSSSDGSGGV
mmetsp:Transcript_24201/g.43013  ORF Transcript_24201/g.43013 Transcript_24201/m.43013 type:complete len:144 (+) Transcript_24201:684-1115(+)